MPAPIFGFLGAAAAKAASAKAAGVGAKAAAGAGARAAAGAGAKAGTGFFSKLRGFYSTPVGSFATDTLLNTGLQMLYGVPLPEALLTGALSEVGGVAGRAGGRRLSKRVAPGDEDMRDFLGNAGYFAGNIGTGFALMNLMAPKPQHQQVGMNANPSSMPVNPAMNQYSMSSYNPYATSSNQAALRYNGMPVPNRIPEDVLRRAEKRNRDNAQLYAFYADRLNEYGQIHGY